MVLLLLLLAVSLGLAFLGAATGSPVMTVLGFLGTPIFLFMVIMWAVDTSCAYGC